MNKRTKLIAGAVVAASVIGVGTGVGIAAGGESEKPLGPSDSDQAAAAALDHVGEGTVTETEVGDDGAAYGVEIRLPDGSQVEVQLDGNFEVVGSTADDDGANDEEESGESD